MTGNNFVLWQNDEYIVKTPFNPHQPYKDGLHIIVAPKADLANAWEDSAVAGRAFALAAKVVAVAESLQLAPWANLQANGNWGLLPGASPFFHIHIYGRNKTERWGKPIALPDLPDTYQNDPMPEEDRTKLIEALEFALNKKGA